MAAIAFDTNITGLRGLWQMEDATDSSGVGNNLTNNNTVTFTAGQFNNAANFGSANSNKSLSLASNPFASQDPGDWSMGMFFKLLAEPGEDAVFHLMQFCTGDQATDAMAFFQYRNLNPGNPQLRIFVAGDSNLDTTYDVTLGTSNNHMIVMTRNGSAIKLYLDNVLVIDTTVTGAAGFAFTDFKFSFAASRNAAEYASVLIDSAFLATSVMPATGDYSVDYYYNGPTITTSTSTTQSTSTSSTTTSSSTSTTKSTSTSSTTTSSSTSTTQSTSTSTTQSTSTSSTTTSSSTSTTQSISSSTSTTTTTLAPGEATYLFDGTKNVADHIQQFISTGFQIGTDARVNSDGVIYYYFAFKKQVDFFDIGTYTGNGVNNRHIGTIFQEALVMIQKTSGVAQAPVYMPLDASSVDATLNFGNSATLTTAILEVESPGFKIGTHDSVNTDTATYTYFVWKNPLQSNFSRKYYEYRVFDANIYQKSWTNEVLTQPSFRNVINGGPGEVIVRLDRSFDNFGENDDVKLNNRVDIWVYDREYPNGQRLYRGFISGYKPVLDGDKEYVEITILSYIFELGYYMLRDGAGATTLAYNSQDPSAILQDIILKYRADGGSINYTANSIQTTNTTVSYTFNSNTVREAIDKVIELAPEGWYWTVDANSIIYLKPRSTTATHTFVIGTHISQMETWRRIEDVVNRVYFTGFTTASGTGMYRIYSNSGSISSYGLHAIHKVDGRVTNTSTADTMSNRILNAKKDPEIRTALTISDNNGENKFRGYDIESVVPGDTLKIRNIKMAEKTVTRWDQATWDTDVWDATLAFTAADVIQILSLDYTPDSLKIEASSRLPEISKRIEDIDRNLTASITVDNPSSPT